MLNTHKGIEHFSFCQKRNDSTLRRLRAAQTILLFLHHDIKEDQKRVGIQQVGESADLSKKRRFSGREAYKGTSSPENGGRKSQLKLKNFE